jgi:hypothetical protein
MAKLDVFTVLFVVMEHSVLLGYDDVLLGVFSV